MGIVEVPQVFRESGHDEPVSGGLGHPVQGPGQPGDEVPDGCDGVLAAGQDPELQPAVPDFRFGGEGTTAHAKHVSSWSGETRVGFELEQGVSGEGGEDLERAVRFRLGSQQPGKRGSEPGDVRVAETKGIPAAGNLKTLQRTHATSGATRGQGEAGGVDMRGGSRAGQPGAAIEPPGDGVAELRRFVGGELEDVHAVGTHDPPQLVPACVLRAGRIRFDEGDVSDAARLGCGHQAVDHEGLRVAPPFVGDGGGRDGDGQAQHDRGGAVECAFCVFLSEGLEGADLTGGHVRRARRGRLKPQRAQRVVGGSKDGRVDRSQKRDSEVGSGLSSGR